MKVNFKIFRPGGNITALVEDKVSRSERAKIARRILAERPDVEQVGFISDLGPQKVSLEMMGGEFCVNAIRSVALLWSKRYGKNHIQVKIGNFSELITVKVEGDLVTAGIPLDFIKEKQKVEDGWLVDMEGIRFLVAPSGGNAEELIDRYKHPSFPAVGVAFYSGEDDRPSLDPWVWVESTNTLINETACGSGTIALWKILGDEDEKLIKQPSGSSLNIKATDSLIWLGGEVFEIGSQAVDLVGCVYCGAQVVPHKMAWFNEAITLMMVKFDRRFSGSFIHRSWDRHAGKIAALFFGLMRLLRLSDINHDRSKIFSGRANVIWEEAEKRGIKMGSLRLFKREIECYQAEIAGKKIIFQGLPRPSAKKGDGLWWVDDKAYLKKKLQEAGVPVPRGGAAFTLRRAREIFSLIQKPVIVKPRFGSRGRHSLTFIRTMKDLDHAFHIAKQICPQVIVEEHLVGDVFRGTVIDGKLVGVLGGSPPRIIGDGVKSIQEIIDIKNRMRLDGQGEIRMTRAMEEFLHRQGYSLSSVLKKGEVLNLTEKIGVRYGGESEELKLVTHPKIIRALESAAAVVKSPIIGFDFIIEDIRKDPSRQKWGIIECNSLPFINLHHEPLKGAPVNAASAVWEAVLADRKTAK